MKRQRISQIKKMAWFGWPAKWLLVIQSGKNKFRDWKDWWPR